MTISKRCCTLYLVQHDVLPSFPKTKPTSWSPTLFVIQSCVKQLSDYSGLLIIQTICNQAVLNSKVYAQKQMYTKPGLRKNSDTAPNPAAAFVLRLVFCPPRHGGSAWAVAKPSIQHLVHQREGKTWDKGRMHGSITEVRFYNIKSKWQRPKSFLHVVFLQLEHHPQHDTLLIG